MLRSITATSLCVLAVLGTVPLRAADGPSPAETKLREGLRNTMLQLRTVQGERDTLQAEKAVLEQEKTALTEKVEAVTKEATGAQQTAEKSIAELKDRVYQQTNEALGLRAELDKWKAAQKQAADLAAKKEAERAKLAQQAIELQRRVEDQKTRNLGMFRVGNEILSRYEKFGLGTALTAREPFVGTTRTKLQNLVQDYADKLDEQRIKAEGAGSSAAARGAAPAAASNAPAAPSPAKPARESRREKPTRAPEPTPAGNARRTS